LRSIGIYVLTNQRRTPATIRAIRILTNGIIKFGNKKIREYDSYQVKMHYIFIPCITQPCK
jgi:hypothetical protein